jgi:hypothetical protein
VPDPIGPVARYTVDAPKDWVTHEETVVHLGGQTVGAQGGVIAAHLSVGLGNR